MMILTTFTLHRKMKRKKMMAPFEMLLIYSTYGWMDGKRLQSPTHSIAHYRSLSHTLFLSVSLIFCSLVYSSPHSAEQLAKSTFNRNDNLLSIGINVESRALFVQTISFPEHFFWGHFCIYTKINQTNFFFYRGIGELLIWELPWNCVEIVWKSFRNVIRMDCEWNDLVIKSSPSI